MSTDSNTTEPDDDPVLIGAPERVYLNIGEDFVAGEVDFADLEEVTWCADSVGRFDPEYVRADLLSAANERVQTLQREVDATYKQWCGRDYMHLPLSQAVGAVISAERERTAALQREVEELRADAGRYRWLRQQHWFSSPLFVCKAPGKPSLGSDCPSRDRLDDAVDNAMASKAEVPNG